MKRPFSNLYLGIVSLLMLLENRRIECFQRLLMRKLTSNEMSNRNFDDIRNIVSASLTANEPGNKFNDKKRDTSNDKTDDQSAIVLASDGNNVLSSDAKNSLIYDDEIEDEDGGERVARQIHESEYKRGANSLGERVDKSLDQSELANYDEPDQKDAKVLTKREAKNEDDYDYDDPEINPESVDFSISTDRKKNDIARSTIDETNADDVKKIDNPRETRSYVDDSSIDYEKEIEDQIQQRIDSIKEDIKREIERKQQVREIEANNAKFDELEFPRDDDEIPDEASLDTSKRSISPDPATSNDSEKLTINVRSKRRSDNEPDEITKNDDAKNSPLPVKKRTYARRVTLVEKRDTRKRKARSSILIPERGRAEVKDELPSDLTLDPNLRIARSYEEPRESENLRLVRSPRKLRNEYPAERYRRDMTEELDDKFNEANETPDESSNFLFASREKTDSRARRRRSRVRDRTRSIERGKGRKYPRHSRRHRTIRESSMNDRDHLEERDKRAMSLDENAALEYKESFGGFPSEYGGALGRFKRIKRSDEHFPIRR